MRRSRSESYFGFVVVGVVSRVKRRARRIRRKRDCSAGVVFVTTVWPSVVVTRTVRLDEAVVGFSPLPDTLSVTDVFVVVTARFRPVATLAALVAAEAVVAAVAALVVPVMVSGRTMVTGRSADVVTLDVVILLITGLVAAELRIPLTTGAVPLTLVVVLVTVAAAVVSVRLVTGVRVVAVVPAVRTAVVPVRTGTAVRGADVAAADWDCVVTGNGAATVVAPVNGVTRVAAAKPVTVVAAGVAGPTVTLETTAPLFATVPTTAPGIPSPAPLMTTGVGALLIDELTVT